MDPGPHQTNIIMIDVYEINHIWTAEMKSIYAIA